MYPYIYITNKLVEGSTPPPRLDGARRPQARARIPRMRGLAGSNTY